MDPKDKNAEPEKERQETNFATSNVARILDEISKNQQDTLGLGKSGARVAGQAGRLTAQAGTRAAVALFATPAGWVIIAVGLVVIITFVIVFSVGGGGGLAPTPTPAEP